MMILKTVRLAVASAAITALFSVGGCAVLSGPNEVILKILDATDQNETCLNVSYEQRISLSPVGGFSWVTKFEVICCDKISSALHEAIVDAYKEENGTQDDPTAEELKKWLNDNKGKKITIQVPSGNYTIEDAEDDDG